MIYRIKYHMILNSPKIYYDFWYGENSVNVNFIISGQTGSTYQYS